MTPTEYALRDLPASKGYVVVKDKIVPLDDYLKFYG